MRIDPRPPLPTVSEKTPAVDAIQPVQPRQSARFEAVLSKREIRARRSVRADVEQASTTSGISPELFGTARSVELLEYVLEYVVPELDAEPQIRELAQALIREEIDLRRSLEEQRAEAQA
jgi:hypothetical protein